MSLEKAQWGRIGSVNGGNEANRRFRGDPQLQVGGPISLAGPASEPDPIGLENRSSGSRASSRASWGVLSYTRDPRTPMDSVWCVGPAIVDPDRWCEYVPIVGLSFFTVVFDADDPVRVARFWAAVLERELIESGPEWAVLSGEPRIDFMKVPEGKTVKNRVHLDWYAPDREAEVQRLIGLGATRLWDVKNEDFEWTTLADIEGNEFCVVQSQNAGG